MHFQGGPVIHSNVFYYHQKLRRFLMETYEEYRSAMVKRQGMQQPGLLPGEPIFLDQIYIGLKKGTDPNRQKSTSQATIYSKWPILQDIL